MDLATLRSQYQRQIGRRPLKWHSRMTNILAMTARIPHQEAFRFLNYPVGKVLWVGQSYHVTGQDKHIALVGVRGVTNPDGVTEYGCSRESQALAKDLAFCPRPQAYGKVLPEENELFRDVLELDAGVQLEGQRSFRLPVLPRLPKLRFAFADAQAVQFEDSPALRHRVALHMAKSETGWTVSDMEAKLDGMEPGSRELLLKAEWDSVVLPLGHPENDTPHTLVEARYVTGQTAKAVKVYEFVGGLLGGETENPVKWMLGKQFPNPIPEAVRQTGFDLSDLDKADFEEVAKVVEVSRKIMGRHGSLPSEYDFLQAIVNPDEPLLIARDSIDSRPGKRRQTRRDLRQILPQHVSECVTDADLDRAIECPNEPLRMSWKFSPQYIRLQKGLPAEQALQWGPETLGQPMRIDFLSAAKTFWKGAPAWEKAKKGLAYAS